MIPMIPIKSITTSGLGPICQESADVKPPPGLEAKGLLPPPGFEDRCVYGLQNGRSRYQKTPRFLDF